MVPRVQKDESPAGPPMARAQARSSRFSLPLTLLATLGLIAAGARGAIAQTPGAPAAAPAPAPAPEAEAAPGGSHPDVQAPELLEFVEAEYPSVALEAGREGSVVLKLAIDAAGSVVDASVERAAGDGFDEAARAAALRFRFSPARRAGEPVASRILYRYEFRRPAEPAPASAAGATPPAAGEDRAIEVVVRGLSGGERLAQSAQAVTVIDLEVAQRHTADVGEVLARTEGVAVQRAGGLGSSSRLSLHGLTDDQIRVFLDGVPLEFSGFGLGIATVPLSWLERIDVYRGVVPVSFGADALGGVVQLVTDEALRGTTASASYTAGAFDTHQLGANLSHLDEASGFLARAAAFYDVSDNDYVVRVDVPDSLGRLAPANVRRFHDGYRGAGASLELGYVDQPWAKRLLLRLFATDFDKDLQHNVNMTVPYGAVEYGQTVVGGTLKYENPRAFGKRIGAAGLVGFSHRSLDFQDTSRWVYDWFGNRIFERPEGSGELSQYASDLTQWENRVLGRASIDGRLARGHTLHLVLSPDFTTRSGEERLRVNPQRIDPLTTRREILNLVAGLEHELRDADDQLENRAFVKAYDYRPSTDQVETFDNSLRHIEDSILRFGAGDAVRVRLLDGLMAKASYEYATRLPRADEVFGDGTLLTPNLELSPESSHNSNLGARYQTWLGERSGQLEAEVSGFLRRTNDMIVELPTSDRIHSIFQNVVDVRTVGVDGALRWTSTGEWLALQANGTWQDQRNVSDSGPFSSFAGQRIPNRPWLFANASATLRIPGVGAENAALSLSWFSRYVRRFQPGWEDTNATDYTGRIPTQLVHAAGINYSVHGTASVDASLDVQNLTDARVYDVLGVQRPGRAAFFKLLLCWDCDGPSAAPPSDL
jgi:vitamin B12 transporter